MKLSDTRLVILSSAGQRADRRVYPVETKLIGGALQKVLSSLLTKQLVEDPCNATGYCLARCRGRTALHAQGHRGGNGGAWPGRRGCR